MKRVQCLTVMAPSCLLHNISGSLAPIPFRISRDREAGFFLFADDMKRRIDLGPLYSRSGSYTLISEACRWVCCLP